MNPFSGGRALASGSQRVGAGAQHAPAETINRYNDAAYGEIRSGPLAQLNARLAAIPPN